MAKYLCRKLILPPKGFSPPAQPPGVTAHAASATVAADAAAAADADAATDAAAEASNASGREACAWVETIAVAPLRAFEEGVGKRARAARARTATTATREAATAAAGEGGSEIEPLTSPPQRQKTHAQFNNNHNRPPPPPSFVSLSSNAPLLFRHFVSIEDNSLHPMNQVGSWRWWKAHRRVGCMVHNCAPSGALHRGPCSL